ncbi:hypothetical protein N7448_003560 [Penicillium atrosanguineum]|nr:hypothetical protein N7448_003560 [Penicillium atrosanguineum]
MFYPPDEVADRRPSITDGIAVDHGPVSDEIQKEMLPNSCIVDLIESNSSGDVETRSSVQEDYDPPYAGNDHPPRGHPSGSTEEEDENIEGRVEDNTMLWVFKDRLDVAEAQQGLRRAMLENDKALCWDFIQRLDQLSAIQVWPFEIGDEFNLNATIAPIKEAYVGDTLKWQPNKVTYWSRGRQLCKPRKLDWGEFMRFCNDNKGREGFWVKEGPTLEAVRRMVVTAGTMQIGGGHLFLYDPETTLKLLWKSHRWENSFLSKAGTRMMDFDRRDRLRQLPQQKRFKSGYSGISTKKRLPPILGLYTTKVVNGKPVVQYCRVVDIELFGKKLPE